MREQYTARSLWNLVHDSMQTEAHLLYVHRSVNNIICTAIIAGLFVCKSHPGRVFQQQCCIRTAVLLGHAGIFSASLLNGK